MTAHGSEKGGAGRSSYNVYLTQHLHDTLSCLLEAGLPASSVARLAIRKWSAEQGLPESGEASCPCRVNVYLSSPEVAALDEIANAYALSRAEALRRLIASFLDSHHDAVHTLFFS